MTAHLPPEPLYHCPQDTQHRRGRVGTGGKQRLSRRGYRPAQTIFAPCGASTRPTNSSQSGRPSLPHPTLAPAYLPRRRRALNKQCTAVGIPSRGPCGTRSREGRSREWEEARAPPALRTGPTRAHAADLSAAEVGVTGYCQRLWIPTRGNQDVVPGKGRPPKEHRARDGQSFCGQCCIWTVWSGSPLAAGGGGWGLRDDINGITAVWVHHGRPPPPHTPSLVPP